MLKNILKTGFLLYLTSLLNLPLYSQSTNVGLNSVIGKLQKYSVNNALEKAYLQFDKPYYVAGDTIYFKAYVTIGAQHKLSALSGILHVDLIGPGNKINRTIQLQVLAGTAWGDFALPDTLKGGNYRVRAYTNWMRNEVEDSFFEQSIPVGTTTAKKIAESGGFSDKKQNTKAAINKAAIQFMPEGGSLVAGNYSKIAFKAITADGLGTDLKGTIIDDAGAPVCTFAAAHLGMGAFNFVPEDGKSYKAQITYADGTINTVALPHNTKTGYTLSLNNTDADTIRLRITAGKGSPMDKLSLVAQSGGIIYYVAESQSGNKLFSAVIPKSKFPTGVAQFTLFSAAGEPLNERLAFINNNDQLKLAVAAKESYAPRQKVEIKLNVKDKNSTPVTAGSFSVSVIDESNVPVNETSENTILANLLLTSELKGLVEQPNYYFTNVNEKTNADLDLLMLTQGYRHFSWKKILSDEQLPATYPYQPEKSLAISGSVKTGGNKPVAGAKVTLFTKSGGPFLTDTLTDAEGKFTFPGLTFGDSVKFVVQAKVAKGQNNLVLNLDSAAAPATMNFITTTAPNLLADTSAYLANQRLFFQEQQKYGINKHAVMLKEVIVKDRKIEPVRHSENLNGSGNADQVLTVKEIEKMNCARLTDCLSGVLTGIIFRGGLPLNQRAHQAVMSVILDGLLLDEEQADRELNMHLHADDIEGIEVITGPHYGAIYGSSMANGGIIITTKRGRKINNYERYAPGVITFMPKGYYKAREFYSPQYDNPKSNKQMADLRSTIFWKPDIVTGKDGVASFEYFNADSKGTYRVVIEGIDADGNLGRQVYRYRVE